MGAPLKDFFVPTFLGPTLLLLAGPTLLLLAPMLAPRVSLAPFAFRVPPSGDFRLPWLGQYGPG
jgi:hypothetical protein